MEHYEAWGKPNTNRSGAYQTIARSEGIKDMLMKGLMYDHNNEKLQQIHLYTVIAKNWNDAMTFIYKECWNEIYVPMENTEDVK